MGAGTYGTIDPTEYVYNGTTGQLIQVQYTAGGSTASVYYGFDQGNQITRLTDWLSSGTANGGLTYAYDGAGRLTSLTDYDGSTLTALGSKTWDYDYNALGHPTHVSIPNGMTTVHTYDTRNRLTKIELKDESTVLDGWTYSLDDQGNITRTDQQDGSYWTYGYDGRCRLTTADRYEASGSSIRAQYAYAYDAADNLTAKTEPFLDDFEDGNATGSSLGTGWNSTTKVLKESYATATRFTRNNRFRCHSIMKVVLDLDP